MHWFYQSNSIKSIMVKAAIVASMFSVGYGCQFEGGKEIAASDVYKLHCKRCHGSDGKKGKKGAKDLNLSTMDLSSRVTHISAGKGKMPSFEDRLSEEQIRNVARFTMETFSVKTDSIAN